MSRFGYAAAVPLPAAPLTLPDNPYRTFALWIAEEKQRRRPDGLYLVGLQGSIGQGKSVLNKVLQSALNELLKGQSQIAAGCSIDDYYLPHAQRQAPDFLARGYNPPGISNRGPAGTHDVTALQADLRRMEAGQPVTLPQFDKQRDDRLPQGLPIPGPVGVFILDGWFLGAAAPPKGAKLPPGLPSAVGEALKAYQPIFERLDALWSFENPGFDQIIANRRQQQRTLDAETGRPGMTEDQIRRFVTYFYKDAWAPGLTSPEPPIERVSFLARLDSSYQLVGLRPGAKPPD